MMNQNMHNWIAMALSIATIKIIFQKYNFNELDNEFEQIVFFVDLVAPIIFLGIWFYFIY